MVFLLLIFSDDVNGNIVCFVRNLVLEWQCKSSQQSVRCVHL